MISFSSQPDDAASKGTATECVLHQIVSYIREHSLTEGDPLPTADALGREFGFSRVIVREALSYLKGMGIIESGRGAGYRLAKIKPLESFANLLPFFFHIAKDQHDITELRFIIELGAYPRIAANVTDEQLAEMKQILDESDSLLQNDDFRNMDFIRLDCAFHSLLARISKVHMLEIVTQTYFKESSDFANSMSFVRPKDLEVFRQTNREHHMIFDALQLHAHDVGFLALYHHLGNLQTFI